MRLGVHLKVFKGIDERMKVSIIKDFLFKKMKLKDLEDMLFQSSSQFFATVSMKGPYSQPSTASPTPTKARKVMSCAKF